MLKLFLISQSEVSGYDTYASAVVCARNEDEARKIHPNQNAADPWRKSYPSDCWASRPEAVEVKLLGRAAPGSEPGVILSSFHAG